MYPGLSSSKPMIIKQDGKAVTQDLYATKGNVLVFQRPTRLYLQHSMRPETFSYWEMAIVEKHLTSTIILEFYKYVVPNTSLSHPFQWLKDSNHGYAYLNPG